MKLSHLLSFLLPLMATPLNAAELSISPTAVQAKHPAAPPRLFVIAIGVAKFQDPFWPELKWPEKDAQSIAAALGADTDYQREVTLLTGPAATLTNIQAALARAASQARSSDALAVYISTHGTLAVGTSGTLQPILVLSSTKPQNLISSGLAESELRQLLDRVPTAHKMLILAACHSGIGKSRLSPEAEQLLRSHKGSVAPLNMVSSGAYVFAAAGLSETAREDDALKGDVYTHYFLEGLASFDRNRDGAVSALEAHDYATARTFAQSSGRQRPTLEAQTVGDGDIILRGRLQQRGLPLFEERSEAYTGISVSVDQGVKGRLPTALALTPGKSLVELYRESEQQPFASFELKAPPGARVGMDELLIGQPWSIGVGLGAMSLTAARSKELITDTPHQGTLYLSYRAAPQWALGLGYSMMEASLSGLRSGVAGALKTSSLEGFAHYVYADWQAFSFGGGAAIGSSRAQLRLSDSDSSLNYQARTVAYAPLVFAAWSVRRMTARLELRYTTANYDFGYPGAMNLDRAELNLYLLYRFGGVARRQ